MLTKFRISEGHVLNALKTHKFGDKGWCFTKQMHLHKFQKYYCCKIFFVSDTIQIIKTLSKHNKVYSYVEH